MKKIFFATIILFVAFLTKSSANTLTAIPGPDDQGGMIMPMVGLSGNTLELMFMPPADSPDLKDLAQWSAGDDFEVAAAWYSLLNPLPGGQGALFNNQYGFMWSGILPSGKSLGIRLVSLSSNNMQSWNYVNNQNRFDEVFTNIGDQVLWNGNMWHNYFTLPNNSVAGNYTASFEVFIANATFTAGTGWVDYTPGALAATQDMDYSTIIVNYSWDVVPEPSEYFLLLCSFVIFAMWRLRRMLCAAE